jgi:hypothetical protein
MIMTYEHENNGSGSNKNIVPHDDREALRAAARFGGVPRIQYRKGRYKDADGAEIPLGSVFLAELRVTYTFLEFGEPGEGVIREVPFNPATEDRDDVRESLGRTDEWAWEENSDGSKIDPIPLSASIRLIDPTTGEAFEFSTISKTGLQAFSALAANMLSGSMLVKNRGCLPKVALNSKENEFVKDNRKIVYDAPVLKIVGWERITDDAPAPRLPDNRPAGKTIIESGGRPAPQFDDSLDNDEPF